MEINADFAQPAFAHTATMEWVPSPMAGVDRRMLDRVGGEVARATSIVRYAEGSSFPEHTHSGGEEFIVLDGVFQDEHGDYPAGTYVRTIFVKLWQFDPADQDQFAVDLNTLPVSPDPERPGVSSASLAERDYETVAFEVWEPGAIALLAGDGGVEALVLEGSVRLGQETFGRHDWIRLPVGASAEVSAGEQGVRLWIKRDHLRTIRDPAKVA